MNYKYTTIDNLKIAYLEVNEDGKNTIFFIHGMLGSSNAWLQLLNDKIFKNFRLIAIDLPGHGASSHSKDPNEDYSPTGTASIVAKSILQLAGNNQYILVGISYGCTLIAEILDMNIQPSGIVFISPTIVGKDIGLDKIFFPTDTPSIFTYNESKREKVEEFLKPHIAASSTKTFENVVVDYLKTSADLISAIFHGVANGKISDEIQLIQNTEIPVLVIFGKDDKLANNNFLDHHPIRIWNNQIVKIPSAGHWPMLDQPEAVSELIQQYSTLFLKSIK